MNTTARYLLDANIAIYLIKGEAPNAASRMALCAEGEVVTSSICLAEILVKLDDDQQRRLKPLLDAVPVLPFETSAAACYAQLPFKLKGFDRLIAAHSLALNLTLVTANPSDFSDIPHLRIENWAAQ